MSPLEIRILLHYHYSPVDFEDFIDGTLSKASQEFIARFLANGCLQPKSEADFHDQKYVLGPRGQAFVAHICALPLPREVWTMEPVSESWKINVVKDFELSNYWKEMSVADRVRAIREKQPKERDNFQRPGRGPQGD